MSFNISWYTQKRIIYIELTDEISLDDIANMTSTCEKMIGEGIAPVHVLLDDSSGGRPPVSLSQIKSRMPLGDNQALGWVVALGEAHPIAMFLVPLLMKILKIDFVRHQSLTAALDFLERHDATLTSEYSKYSAYNESYA